MNRLAGVLVKGKGQVLFFSSFLRVDVHCGLPQLLPQLLLAATAPPLPT